MIARIVTFSVLAALSISAARSAEIERGLEFAQKATWTIPSDDAVRRQIDQWLAQRPIDDGLRSQIGALLTGAKPSATGGQMIDRAAAVMALVDPRAQAIVEVCARPRAPAPLPEIAWLEDEKTPALVRDNLRLLLGRTLAQQSLYDEALGQLKDLKPEQVIDPAGLLFYQSVVYHRLLAKEPGLEAIARLMEREHEIPRRYVSVARLMQADLEPLKEDTLDHISRRMDDVRRRLDLGRAGPKVREVEDGVIASLDKLIKELEKQQQDAAAAAANAQNILQPSRPAQDSMPMGGKGRGDVAHKNIGNQSGWGNLPPKKRQEALQQIGKDFPAHYRDVIEQYFRKLASEEQEK